MPSPPWEYTPPKACGYGVPFPLQKQTKMHPEHPLSRFFKVLNPGARALGKPPPPGSAPAFCSTARPKTLTLRGGLCFLFLTSCVTPLELKNSQAPVLALEEVAPLSLQSMKSRGGGQILPDLKPVRISSFFWGWVGGSPEVQVQDLCPEWKTIRITRTFAQQMILLFSLGVVAPMSVFVTCPPDKGNTSLQIPREGGGKPSTL